MSEGETPKTENPRDCPGAIREDGTKSPMEHIWSWDHANGTAYFGAQLCRTCGQTRTINLSKRIE